MAWVFTKDGFFSIVAPKEWSKVNYPDCLWVRARIKKDIEKFCERINEIANEKVIYNKYLETKNRDYRYRVLVPKWLVAKYMSMSIEEINYSNFKDAACKGDLLRKEAYFQVWATMLNFQHFSSKKSSRKKNIN